MFHINFFFLWLCGCFISRRPLGSKKPCHCTRSMCLKLYCDCFANGEFCNDCDCKDCKNTIEYEIERTRAIRLSLERNPNAFKPKIGNMLTISKNSIIDNDSYVDWRDSLIAVVLRYFQDSKCLACTI